MAALEFITENIGLWASAIRAKPTQGRGSNKKLELYGIKKLRELILELAVRGKLVPQDPNDEPASVLLERIAAEKQKLVKQMTIKKPKKLPEIVAGELPFTLPVGWKWARLQDMTRYIQRGMGPQYDDLGTVRVVSQKCVQWSGFDIGVSRHIANESLGRYQKERFLQTGDLLWNSTGTGTVGRIVELDEIPAETLVADSHVTVVRPLEVLGGFLKAYIAAPGIQSRFETDHKSALVSGSTNQVELNTSAVEKLEVPIPPKAEQHRIVAKVDELMALCDQLEQRTEASAYAHQLLVDTLLKSLINAEDASELSENWRCLSEHFDTLITTDYAVERLKQTILQLAVMGKLVPQDPSDEPASELLKRIAAEKSQLISDQKIKKQKPLPEILDEEKPFSLPSGWVWSRIGESSLYSEYGISAKTFDTEHGIPVLKMGDIQSGKVVLGDQKKASIDFKDISGLMLNHGDILYNRTNSAELVGKTGRYEGPDNYYSFASYLIRIRCSEKNVCSEFLNLNMNSPLFRVTQVEPYLKQQCGQANINGTIMKNMIVAIAPINEQKRIISKVNDLTILLENLKFRLQASRNTQTRLSGAIVDQLLLTHG